MLASSAVRLPRNVQHAFWPRPPEPLGPPGGGPSDPRRAPGLTRVAGIAISEAVEVAAQDPTINYALGSVLNHVLMHQTIIGGEALLQLAKIGEENWGQLNAEPTNEA